MELNRGLSRFLAQAVHDATGTPGDGGRPADFRREDDALACANLIARLRSITVPDNETGPCQYADTVWKGFVPGLRSAAPFGGSTLSVTDWDPGSIIISGGDAFIRVWHRPMIAAAWFDAAAAILALIADGWDPADAEAFFRARDGAFADLPAEYLTRFIRAQQLPLPGPSFRNLRLAGAARRWHSHDHARGPRALAGGRAA